VPTPDGIAFVVAEDQGVVPFHNLGSRILLGFSEEKRAGARLTSLRPPLLLLGIREAYRWLLPSFCKGFTSPVSSLQRGAVVMSRSNVLIGRFLLCTVLFVPAVAGAQQDSSESTRRVTNRVVPTYPELARTMNAKGSVRLEVVVAPNGTVKSVKVIGGHPVLVQAAERAVQKWKWERAGHESNEAIELRFNPE
jgi:TonB family protein